MRPPFNLSWAGKAAARGAFAALDGWSRLGSRFGVYRRADLTLLLDRANLIDRRLIAAPMVAGGWERGQTAYLHGQVERLARVTQAPMRFLDVGAHWGYYSLLAMRWGRFARIDAFEPDPINHAQLLAQLFLNDAVSTVNVHQLAVTDVCGQAPWRLSSGHPTGNRGGVGLKSENGTTSVRAGRLDDEIVRDGETFVVKIDVEGSEVEALRGAQRLLAGSPALLQVESYNFVAEVEAMLQPLGYERIHAIRADHYYTNVADLGGRGVAG